MALAALAVGAVALGPVGEVLFYGLEGFPVDADVKRRSCGSSPPPARSPLLLIGAAAGAAVCRGRARGWPPSWRRGCLVAGPARRVRPRWRGLRLRRTASAGPSGRGPGRRHRARRGRSGQFLPASPAGGDLWPVAAFAARALVDPPPVPPEFLPGTFRQLRSSWAGPTSHAFSCSPSRPRSRSGPAAGARDPRPWPRSPGSRPKVLTSARPSTWSTSAAPPTCPRPRS